MELSNYIETALLIIGAIVWFVRLEGRVNYLEKSQEKLYVKVNDMDSQIIKELSQIRQAVARIEGRLSAHEN